MREESRKRPDILLLVLDTLRADRLSCYGHPTETSPTLDAFAETGTRFERAISPAQWTIPAHGSLFSGEYPTTHGTTQITHKHAPGHPTLAEHLDRARARNRFERLTLIAEPRFLGLLRDHLAAETLERVARSLDLALTRESGARIREVLDGD